MGIKLDNRIRGISGSTLKIIAMVVMLIDHVGAVLVSRLVLSGHYEYYDMYTWMRLIGRTAFPIYCFLLVEGFYKTRNAYRYAFRLLLFAFLSEIPFDLAFNETFLYFKYQNTFFTLLIGFWVMIGLDTVKKRVENRMVRIPLELGIVIVGALSANALRSDYGSRGVLCIVVLYLLHEYPKALVIVGGGFTALLLNKIAVLPAFALIACYNGQRGMTLKYFFYVFYPLHLLILYGICRILQLM